MDYEQLSFIETNCPQMPEEYKGNAKTWGGITKNIPREWTKEEVEWCLTLKRQGYKIDEIAESVGREKTSVSIKLKRLTKEKNTYNIEHLSEKYLLNDAFYDEIRPNTVLDVFTGEKQYWKAKCKCLSNDKNPQITADFHLDALKFVCQEYFNGNKYDIVDLDPYGSAYDCFNLAIKIATKGIIITYGEMGHKRWKRLDFVRDTYGIQNIDDFTVDNLIKKTQEIGRHNHKDLIVRHVGNWRNISRVYFEIQPYKVTEQWEGKEA